MLNGTADATGDINLGTNGDTSLTNLQVVVGKASIHSSTTGTNLGMKHLGEFIELVETFLRAHTITTSHDDAGTLQIVLGGLNVTVENLRNILCLRHKLCHILYDDLTLVVGVENLGLHHARTDCSHLGTVLGIDNRCNDVTTEGRTNLIEQVLVGLAQFLVLVRTDFQSRAVGSQTAVQGRRNARSEVAAHNIGTHQANLRLFLLKQVHQHCSMRLRGVGSKALSIENVQLIHAVGENLALHLSRDTAAGSHGFQLHTQRVGQLAAFSEQFLAYFGNLSAFKLTIYKYVIHYPIV